MSLSITINNINTLSEAERAVLRLIAGNEASVADTLKQTVRDMAVVASPELLDANQALREEVERLIADKNELNIDAECQAIRIAELEAELATTKSGSIAPASSVPPPPATPANPNLDANGLPWDKRIHSSSRAKVADGTWRYARNLDKALIATVEAELRAVQAIPSPAPAAATTTTPAPCSVCAEPQFDTPSGVTCKNGHGGAPEMVGSPAGWPFGTGTPEAQDAAAVVQDAAPAPVAAPIVPLPPVVPLPPAPSALPMTFAQLMQHVTPLLVSGKLTQPILQQAVEKCGLPHLAALGARPDLVETVKAAIDEAVGGVQ